MGYINIIFTSPPVGVVECLCMLCAATAFWCVGVYFAAADIHNNICNWLNRANWNKGVLGRRAATSHHRLWAPASRYIWPGDLATTMSCRLDEAVLCPVTQSKSWCMERVKRIFWHSITSNLNADHFRWCPPFPSIPMILSTQSLCFNCRHREYDREILPQDTIHIHRSRPHPEQDSHRVTHTTRPTTSAAPSQPTNNQQQSKWIHPWIFLNCLFK